MRTAAVLAMKLVWTVELAGYFLVQVIVSNIEVARCTLSSGARLRQLRPAIVAVPLELRSEWSIWLFAQMITLTPGTLTLHLHQRNLFVHVLDTVEPKRVVKKLKEGFELRLLRLES